MVFNKLKLYAIIVTIILLLGLGYFGYNYIQNKAYQKGINDGAIQVINGIGNTGNFPYFETIENVTTLKYISINQI